MSDDRQSKRLYLSEQVSRFWHEGQRRWKHKRDGAGEIGDLTAVKAHYHAVAQLEKKWTKNNNIINKDKQIGRQEMEAELAGASWLLSRTHLHFFTIIKQH